MIALLKDGFCRNTWWSRLIFAGLVPLFGILYPLSNRLAASMDRAVIWQFPIDSLIPFSRWFILPYYYWYVQIAIAFAWLIFSPRTGRLLHRMVLTLIIADVIGAVFFIAMPTFMIRPAVTGSDLLSQMVRSIYRIDLPYNCFPSMHVFWATILCRYWNLFGPRRLWFRLVNYIGTAMIIVSTVFTKQHYTPDIIGGLAAAGVSCLLADRLFARFGRCCPEKLPQMEPPSA